MEDRKLESEIERQAKGRGVWVGEESSVETFKKRSVQGLRVRPGWRGLVCEALARRSSSSRRALLLRRRRSTRGGYKVVMVKRRWCRRQYRGGHVDWPQHRAITTLGAAASQCLHNDTTTFLTHRSDTTPRKMLIFCFLLPSHWKICLLMSQLWSVRGIYSLMVVIWFFCYSPYIFPSSDRMIFRRPHGGYIVRASWKLCSISGDQTPSASAAERSFSSCEKNSMLNIINYILFFQSIWAKLFVM